MLQPSIWWWYCSRKDLDVTFCCSCCGKAEGPWKPFLLWQLKKQPKPLGFGEEGNNKNQNHSTDSHTFMGSLPCIYSLRNFHFGAPAVSCQPCPSMCNWNMPWYMHMCNQCVYVYIYKYKWYMYVPFCETCILSMWIDAWANSKYFHNQLLKPDVVWGWCNSARKTAVYK